jgi:NitT/TauT family transport system substrate-binding protein
MVISLDELFGLPPTGSSRALCWWWTSHGADVVDGRGGMKSCAISRASRLPSESALGAFVLSRALAINGMQASDVNVVHSSRTNSRRVRKGWSMAPSRSTRSAHSF